MVDPEPDCLCLFVCLSVCMPAGQLKKLRIGFQEIFTRGKSKDYEQVMGETWVFMDD